MEHITITDILNNKVSDNSTHLFLLIHTSKPKTLLYKLSTNGSTDSIYMLNNELLNKLLAVNNIDSNNYSTTGHLWFNQTDIESPITILLVNNSILTNPVDYVKIDRSGNLNIWRPIPPKNYQDFGLIVSDKKPKLNATKVINSQYLIEYSGPSVMNIRSTNLNEYNLLSHIDFPRFTVNKNLNIQQYVTTWKPKTGSKYTLSESNIPWHVLKETAFQHIPKPVTPEPVLIKSKININVIIISLIFVILFLIFITKFIN